MLSIMCMQHSGAMGRLLASPLGREPAAMLVEREEHFINEWLLDIC